MSFTDSKSRKNRSAFVAVAALHAAAIYALVTGLGVTYVKQVIANLPTTNYKNDPPPPPQERPKELPKSDDRLLAPKMPFESLIDDSRLFVPVQPDLPDLTFPDIPLNNLDPGGTATTFTPAGPRPRGNPGAWATTNDYPAHELRQGNQGTAQFALTVDADGKVSDCAITRSSGHPALDDATCRNVSRRARFEPATDRSGAKVAGTYTGSIKWVIPD